MSDSVIHVPAGLWLMSVRAHEAAVLSTSTNEMLHFPFPLYRYRYLYLFLQFTGMSECSLVVWFMYGIMSALVLNSFTSLILGSLEAFA